MTPAIQQLITSFGANLYVIVRAEMRAEVTAEVAKVLNGSSVTAPRRGPGRPPSPQLNGLSPGAKPRKKGPIQLCPAPGCKERAAPVFGMVCSKHKGLPKAAIKKYREARRAKAKKAA
jgi:hypothetical protein